MTDSHKVPQEPPECHPDCGPIVACNREFGKHAHQDEDGVCWHDDEDA